MRKGSSTIACRQRLRRKFKSLIETPTKGTAYGSLWDELSVILKLRLTQDPSYSASIREWEKKVNNLAISQAEKDAIIQTEDEEIVYLLLGEETSS